VALRFRAIRLCIAISKTFCRVDAPRISSITILTHGTKLELDGYAWLIGADRKSEELFIGSR
jgi:hypothetical protein